MSGQQQFCTFFLNGIYFGIEVEQVQEVIRYQQMTPVPLAPIDICGLINLRGQIVTAIDLRRRLDMNQKSVQPLSELEDEQLPLNVVVRIDSEVVSLLVDEVGDIIEVTQDNFEPPPTTLKGSARSLLRGAYKLKDKLLLILDTEKILSF